MLALIERKLNSDDRKVWFRHLDNNKKDATLAVFVGLDNRRDEI